MIAASIGVYEAVTGVPEFLLILKATLVVVAGLGVLAVARRARASRRHLVLALTFAVLLLLPVSTSLAPALPIRAFDFERVLTVTPRESMASWSGRDGTHSPSRAIDPVALSAAQASARSLLVVPLWLLWAVGTVASLIPLIATVWHLRWLNRNAVAWPAGEVLACKLTTSSGLRRKVSVLLHDEVKVPMTWRVWRPIIMLPRSASRWSDRDIERALRHELEHVQRADWFVHVAARGACALYWFHPLVWCAWRKLHLEAERACDDAVVSRAEPIAYAAQLVGLAARLSGPASRFRFTLAMASASDLSRRVAAILDQRQQRGAVGLRFASAALASALLLLVALAPSTTASGSSRKVQPSQSTPPSEMESFDVASVRQSDPGSTAFPNSGVVYPGGRFVVTRSPLLLVLKAVYPEYRHTGRIVGGPAWITTELFDIEARGNGDQTIDETVLMVRRLLAERFALRTRVEARQMDVYALVVEREALLERSLRRPLDCQPLDGTHGSFAPSVPRPGELPWCGLSSRTDSGLRRLSAASATLSSLIPQIQMVIPEIPVLDRTSLSETFSFELEFDPRAGRLNASPDLESVVSVGPSIFSAVRDLGLRLDRRKEMLDVLVIEHVEMPSPS